MNNINFYIGNKNIPWGYVGDKLIWGDIIDIPTQGPIEIKDMITSTFNLKITNNTSLRFYDYNNSDIITTYAKSSYTGEDYQQNAVKEIKASTTETHSAETTIRGVYDTLTVNINGFEYEGLMSSEDRYITIKVNYGNNTAGELVGQLLGNGASDKPAFNGTVNFIITGSTTSSSIVIKLRHLFVMNINSGSTLSKTQSYTINIVIDYQ